MLKIVFLIISPAAFGAVLPGNDKARTGYDLVFNTIPVMIFDSDLLMNTDRNTIIIDLASLPGGVDFEAARRYKTDAVRALSLPGRTAPKAAGEIIRKTIFNIIKEVYR